jgi:multidrug resistance efflux pump
MHWQIRRRRVVGATIALAIVAGVSLAVMTGHPRELFRKKPETLGVRTADDGAVPVKVIRPKRDSNFGIVVQQLAIVEPFYQANLRARASGLVRLVRKDIGDHVRQGELLLEIDEPDLEQEVAQKEAVVEQRLQEVDKAKAAVRMSEAELDVAKATVEQRRAESEKEKTTRDTRQKRLNRFRLMLDRQVVDPGVIDEEEGAYLSAVAAVKAADVAVIRAEADLREKQASLEGARTEVKLKTALVEVARRDRDRAQALLDYARVTAPFEGVITARNVDPGAFVQNATTANTEALISVARMDIVTVVFNLPDYAAAFISRGTVVDIQLGELPGVTIRGVVTRYTPAIRSSDRTMRVEVDLFNDTEEAYPQFLARIVTGGLASIGHVGWTALAPEAIARSFRTEYQKGTDDLLPIQPRVEAPGGALRRLIPGMSGMARVRLQEFDDVYLLPTSAIFTMGGKSYILELRDGRSHLVPVRVQVNDGRLAKVAIVVPAHPGKHGSHEMVKELTGQELIIASRQLEVGENQAVKATLEDW